MIKRSGNAVTRLHFPLDFQLAFFILGHSINQTHMGFVGSCSFHPLFVQAGSNQVEKSFISLFKSGN